MNNKKDSDKENEEFVDGSATSEETNQAVEEGTEATVENSEEVDSWEKKFNDLNSKYVLLYSDFDNFRKRTIKEKADIISSASEGVLKELLVVLDDFERAIENNKSVEDVKALREGFDLIHHKLFHILSSKGLEKMEAKGDIFDPEKHEAITNIPAPSDDLKGKVVDVIEKGYNLNGKPLRYAKVVVGQ